MSYIEYTKEDLNKIQEMFNFLDKNKEGSLTIDDINMGIIGLGGELSNKELNHLKSQKDFFDLNDFITICQKKRINVNEIGSKLLLAFSLLEVDKKGFVPSSSIVALLKNDKISDKEIQQLIYEAKPDSDNNINYRNFVKEMLEANYGDESNSFIKNNNNYNDNDDSSVDNYNNNNNVFNNNNVYNNNNAYNNTIDNNNYNNDNSNIISNDNYNNNNQDEDNSDF